MVCGDDPSQCMGVLIDLGLARRVSDDADDDAPVSAVPAGLSLTASPKGMRRVRTPAYSAIGSPAFMAPEQVKDARSVSHAADVYGLGATCYSALTGALPFSGASPTAVMKQVLRGELVPPRERVPSLPPAVEAIVMWMLSREPSERPPLDVLTPTLEAMLAVPDGAPSLATTDGVQAVRERYLQRRARSDALALVKHVACWALAAAVFSGAVWDFMMHQHDVVDSAPLGSAVEL